VTLNLCCVDRVVKPYTHSLTHSLTLERLTRLVTALKVEVVIPKILKVHAG